MKTHNISITLTDDQFDTITSEGKYTLEQITKMLLINNYRSSKGSELYSVMDFITDHTHKCEGRGEIATDVYNKYLTECDNLFADPVGRNLFYTELKSNEGVYVKKSTRNVLYAYGIKITNTHQADVTRISLGTKVTE